MILDIVKYPDPSLGDKAVDIAEITPEIKELAANMLETMYDAEGVGLAAPQIGKALRLVVMDAFYRDGEKKPRALVNPELELSEERIVSENEGCLSVPLNFRADVERAATVRVRALDLEGNQIDEIFEGLPAIIVQHETDHLDGTLFIDRISRLRRNIYDSKVKKWRKSSA